MRKYYKYQYSTLTQPILTSNTFSNEVFLEPTFEYSNLYLAYKVFDNDNSSGWLTAKYSGQRTLTVTATSTSVDSNAENPILWIAMGK